MASTAAHTIKREGARRHRAPEQFPQLPQGIGNPVETVPMVMIPEALLRGGISRTAQLVYVYVRRHLNRKTGQCNPKHATIASRLRVSVATIRRALRELRAAGWLAWKRGHWGCNYECRDRSIPPGNDHSEAVTSDSSKAVTSDQFEQLHLFTEPAVYEPEVKTAAAVKASIPTQPERSRPAASAPAACGAGK